MNGDDKLKPLPPQTEPDPIYRCTIAGRDYVLMDDALAALNALLICYDHMWFCHHQHFQDIKNGEYIKQGIRLALEDATAQLKKFGIR